MSARSTGVGAIAGGAPRGASVVRLLLRLLPAELRAEHGAELLRDYVELLRSGRRGFWRLALSDVFGAAARERVEAWRARRAARARADAYPPPYRAAALAGLAVWALYAATLAPSIGFWDSGEYTTVAHTLGIPHPPGNPLFVLLAHAWEVLLAATRLSPAVRINLFSATASAAAHAFWFLVADRLLATVWRERWPRRLGAACAVALSATAFTVWSQSDVNEKVYTVSLLSTAALTWLALRWRDTGRRTAPLVLGVAILTLTATNHLMGVLAAPALLVFVLLTDARALTRRRFWAAALPVAALCLSVQLFLPLRAAQRPVISEGDPRCASAVSAVASVFTWGRAGCPELSFVLRREQYGKPPVTVDPTEYPNAVIPRGPALVASQVENYVAYFDWQWARSIAGRDPVFGGARPLVTLLVVLLGLAGLAPLRRRDPAAAALLATLFATLSVGLVLYLNFKYGWALERARFPDPAMHEVRERDYFFLVGFSLWGVWAGMGLVRVWCWIASRLERRLSWHPTVAARALAAPVLLLALVPLGLNWRWASRAHDWTARDWAYNVLMSVQPYGVLVTNGDNDSFPLWYAQNVEGIRKDVTIVLSPYLETAWYARQLRDATRPCPAGVRPESEPDRIVCQQPFRPEEMPVALAAAGVAVRPPEDSILPLSDADIEGIAAGATLTDRPLLLRAGHLQATVAAGTTLLPSDTFVGAILRSNLGVRPIHFMPPAPVVEKLGLAPYTVREGLTWRLNDGPVRPGPGEHLVALPKDGVWAGALGAYVDLTRSDTLADQVWLRRGRILDPKAPWVDSANASIPYNYAYALIAMAQGHAQLGDGARARARVGQAEAWLKLVAESAE